MNLSILTAMKGALKGKTLARIFFDDKLEVSAKGLTGRALDLAGGVAPSYLHLLPADLEVVRTSREEEKNVRAVDFNTDLPFEDGSFDSVFLFNALYIVEDPKALSLEVLRILKPGGKWLVLSPFIANEMPQPHDYRRFTSEGLEKLFSGTGFSEVSIGGLGERASSATHLMHPFFLFNIIRAIFFPIALLFDALVPDRIRKEHPTPVSYFVTCKK